MTKHINRRQFLQYTAVTGAALAAACGKDEGEGDPARRVIVIGAGLAGLSAAYELMKQGIDVVVLEAQDRVGGRVYTVRDGFAPGLYAEAGAVRIPDVHDRTLGYVRELGLELAEFDKGESLYVIKGNRFQHKKGDMWPANLMLTAAEQEKGLDIWSDYIASAFPEVGDVRKGTWPLAAARRYDQMTLEQYLKGKGASDDFLRIYKGDNGTEVERFNALMWLAAEEADKDWDKTYAIKGGNDQLPRRLHERLGTRVRLSSPVVRIEYGAERVTVTYQSGGRSETLTGARLISAIPFSILRDVEITPAFPADKARAIRELYMMPAGRVYLQTRTRFWQEEGIGGLKLVRTDTPLERIWAPSGIMPGPAGLLMAYQQHENSLALCRRSKADREAFVRSEMAKIFPRLPQELDGGVYEKCWSEDPWVKGAWAALDPGRISLFPVMGRAEGRVHFAGEHTSVWAGWMQGALESGQRAAAEVMGALGV